MFFSASDEEYQHSVLDLELLTISFVNTICSNVMGAHAGIAWMMFLSYYSPYIL